MHQNFNDLLKDGTIVTGGHFMLTPDGPNLNNGTINSFKEAAELYSEAIKRGLKVSLGLLINDIGTVCSNTRCSITGKVSRDAFSLPKEYRNIIDKSGIPYEKLKVFWEKHLRNRGKKLLHKMIAKNDPHIFHTERGYIYKHPAEKIDIVLTRNHPEDKYGTPACPLIMGAYAIEHKREGYLSSLNFYYVGDDNHQNVTNHFVIEKGKFLAKQIAHDLDIKNVYIFKDTLLKNF